MKQALISIILIFSLLIPSMVNAASISRITLFDIFDIYINTENNDENQINKNIKSIIEYEEQDYEFEYEEKVDLVIFDIQEVNDEFIIQLDKKGYENLSGYQLYINGFLINTRLEKEKYYSDAAVQWFSIEKDQIQNAIFDGYNTFYFKNERTGINGQKYKYFFGPLVTYDNYYRQAKCNGSLDRVILRNASGEIVKDLENLHSKRINLTTNARKRALKSWYYDAKVFCSSQDKDLYYIFDIGFNYKQYSNRNYGVSYDGEYYEQGQYNKIKNKY